MSDSQAAEQQEADQQESQEAEQQEQESQEQEAEQQEQESEQEAEQQEQESEEQEAEQQEQESEEQEAEQQEQESEEQEEQESESQASDEQAAESGQPPGHPRSGRMTADAVTDPEAVDADVDVDREEVEGILTIRQSVQSTATQLIGREFDAVSEIAPTDDGWRAVVEVVERRSVPDTQDVIGRYEIELDTGGTVHGYRRLDRYRRGDTASFE